MAEMWPIYLQITGVYPYALTMAHRTIQVQQYLVVLSFHFEASLHANYYFLISLTAVRPFNKVTSHSACFGKVPMNPKSLKVLKHKQATPVKNHKFSPPSDCCSLSADVSCCYSRPIWHYTPRHHCSQASISPVAVKANSPSCELHKWSSCHLADSCLSYYTGSNFQQRCRETFGDDRVFNRLSQI